MPKHVGDRDNDSAFTINPDTGHWSCWTHQCHLEYGRDLISLVRTYYQCSFKDACSHLFTMLGDKPGLIKHVSHIDRVNRMLKTRGSINAEPLPETMLKQLSPRATYMEARGFSKTILREYEIGYYAGRTNSSFMRDRIIFPIRSIENQLVGFTGRSVIDDTDERKRRGVQKWLNSSSLHLSAYLPKAMLLYNSHKTQKIIRGKTIILVEGPIDVLRLRMAGIHNVCAIMGVSFSLEQEKIIRQMGVRVIVPLFDDDDAGNDTRVKIEKRFGTRDIIQIQQVNLPRGKDPGDLTIEEAKEILHDYII